MDQFIASYPAVFDKDLMLCDGVAYQRDMMHTVSYDEDYFEKCAAYKGNEISRAVHNHRVELVSQYQAKVLDIGIGSGEFIEAFNKVGIAMGYDVNPHAVKWLKSKKLYTEDFEDFFAFTFWDVLEHVPDPSEYFGRIPDGSYVFVSIPIFESLQSIRESKHYRPNEHLYYFTEQGFIEWMYLYGFEPLEVNEFETIAGREGILEFVFER